ncbi:c-type cytochrome biogenesis protein CcmI [Pleionea sp. CnH1-48]|uniref:c-type cytochrome biogenesis protein CcmI n=1 Tax=Pleionea sp. CnH1-48 TaxID=2954494 RepID=UPI0020980BEC|nr:c-type cytochrome biogenesis protein CcmI [Pleionea sp. CnH1-48]MCO7223611.1 c-type cytochrome biogenesis protein CcmI [Pleionea sp. CnH1-48]
MLWIYLAIVSLVSIVLLALPLRKVRKSSADVHRLSLNKAVYQDRLKELENDRELQQLSETEFEALKQELKLTLLEDAERQHEIKNASDHSSLYWITLGIIPILALAIYFTGDSWTQYQHWQQLKEEAAANKDDPEWFNSMTYGDVLLMLRTQLDERPSDTKGWMFLGSVLIDAKAKEEAYKAFERAIAINKTDIAPRMQFAQILLKLGGDEDIKRAEHELKTILTIQPEHQAARLMVGYVRFQQQQYQQAINIWQQLIDERNAAGVEGGEGLKMLQAQIAQAKVRLEQQANPEVIEGDKLTLNIALAPEFKGTVAPNLPVFISVKGDDGSPAPVAVKRITVADLPVQMVLTDRDAMMPGRVMSSMNELTVQARVSFSGVAKSQPGDLSSQKIILSKNKRSNAISLLINEKL